MPAALPPAPAHTPPWYLPYRDPNRPNLFHILAGLLESNGAHIAYGQVADDATWDTTTRTLTLREGDTPEDHTYALSEFCRRWHLGEAYSHYVDAGRHLQIVG